MSVWNCPDHGITAPIPCCSKAASPAGFLSSERVPASETPSDELRRYLAWRDIYSAEDACDRCGGTGKRVYGSTAQWRGGMGGQMMTTGVCDLCWGSGEKSRTFTDLRKAESTVAALRAEVAQLRAERAQLDAIHRWLLGEEGVFPESVPGRRYGFRSELSARLAALSPTPAVPTDG